MEEVEAASSWPVVYVGGWKYEPFRKYAWYRVDLESLKKTREAGESESESESESEIKRVKLNTAVQAEFGLHGNYTIIGEHIYWFGENLGRAPSPLIMDLFRHDINDADPLSWVTLASSSMDYRRFYPIFVAPVGRKLYFLLGTDPVGDEQYFFGEAYDLDTDTWQDLKTVVPNCDRGSYNPRYAALDDNNKQVLFYSMSKGSVLFFDFASRDLRIDKCHEPLNLWNHREGEPPGLEDCAGYLNLVNATRGVAAMLSNNTLYWFTYDLHLYGYSLNHRRWFQSPSLADQLPTLTPLPYWTEEFPFPPFLVDLHNGKFMVIVPEDLGGFTVALLAVSRKVNSLSVTVESSYPFSCDETDFMPITAMSLSAKC